MFVVVLLVALLLLLLLYRLMFLVKVCDGFRVMSLFSMLLSIILLRPVCCAYVCVGRLLADATRTLRVACCCEVIYML